MKMKKLLLILLILCMCGCQEETTTKITIENKTVAVNDTVLTYAQANLPVVEDQTYYIDDGFTVIDCSDEDNLVDSDTTVYPVYLEDTIKYLIVENEEIEIVEVDEELVSKLEEEFAIVKAGSGIYLVDSEGNELIAGKQEDDDMLKINKINSEAEVLSKLSKNKTKVVFSDDSSLYSMSRIVIKFTDASKENISKYAEFCNGELVSYMESNGTYVFQFAEKSYDELQSLLEKSKQLDYVSDAFLEGQSEVPTDPTKNNEVTE